MTDIIGSGSELRKRKLHPYIGRQNMLDAQRQAELLEELNRGRENSRSDHVEATYYFEVLTHGEPARGLCEAARMVLEHGTLKAWKEEGGPSGGKPADYDENMSWATDIRLLGYNRTEGLESGLVSVAYPTHFFHKRSDGRFPLAQLLMAIAGEPSSAFSFYQGAKVVDIRFCESIRKLFPGSPWPHRRIRQYLGLPETEPLIGTIVKPKTGLTPELFSRSVLEAAQAGARFVKADENMHLSVQDIHRYVSRVVRDLENAGFDLGQDRLPNGRRFLFAPHITADYDQVLNCARAAVEAGANALMFSPYYSGGFLKLAEIAEQFDLPVYAHTAGMNVLTGSANWGFSTHLMYYLSAVFGAAFMQLTTMKGYLKPDDEEKAMILSCLRDNNLAGANGMTLAIAGGLTAANVGISMKRLGEEGTMLLAGSSVYGHPDGPGAGVRALCLAYQAYKERKITGPEELRAYALGLGSEGRALAAAL